MKKINYWVPSLLIMLLIYIASDDPLSGEKSGRIVRFILRILKDYFQYDYSYIFEVSLGFLIRKIAHISEYFILALSFFYSYSNTFISNSLKKTCFLSTVSTLLYAISDEYHQTFVPGREGRIDDVLIDSIGILTGYLFIFLLKNKNYPSEKSDI